MPEFEDSSQGQTDISGTPDPVRTPSKVSGDAARKVNRTQRGGQNLLQQAAGAVGGLAQKAGGVAGQAGQGLDQLGRSMGMQQAAERDFNPIDWASQDLGNTWGFARKAYKTLSGDYHDGVHGVFQGHSATDKLLQSGFQSAAEGAMPLLQLYEQARALPAEVGAVKGGDQGKFKQAQHQEAEQTVQDAPGAAANIGSFALPGTVLGKAAMVGFPLAEQLLGGNQDDQHSALAWAAAGSLLSFGHIPGSLRKLLTDRMQDWPVLEKTLQAAMDQKQDADRTAVDPLKAAGKLKDWFAHHLQQGAMPEEYGAKAAALKATPAAQAEAMLTPFGEQVSQSVAQTRRLLNRIGVDTPEELVLKAQSEGISDPKLIQGIIQHWKDLGLPYDLRRYHPEEMPLRDPRRHLDDLPDQRLGVKHAAATNHMLDQIHRGLFANHSNPMTAVLRALAGHSRATNLTHQQYIASITNLLKDEMSQSAQEKIMRAGEGDQEAYDGLSSAAKMVVDGWGHVRAASREVGRGTERGKSVVPNWVARTDRLLEEMTRQRGRPSMASVLSRESRAHREEALTVDPKGQLVLGQRFPYVQDANKALAAARSDLVSKLTGTKTLSGELQNDPGAVAIQSLARVNPEEALLRAKQLAMEKYPDKESNFLLNVNRVMANQIRAIHTERALGEFTQMLTRDGRAAALKPLNQRQREEFERQGYQRLGDPRFESYVFHPDLAANLNRYVNHIKSPTSNVGKFWQTALDLEGKAVAMIMFSPAIHGLNVAGRMGMAALMHPLQMTHYLMNGKALTPAQWDDASWGLRSEAYNAGLVPHHQNQGYSDSMVGKMQDALGDVEDQLPQQMKKNTLRDRLSQFTDPVARPYRSMNNYFWSQVNDFGVMMYHLEKTAARRHGLGEEAAVEYAARRANTWMGTVAAEDRNPLLHDVGRLAFFAPNWWRTWAELMVPLYKRAGFTQDANWTRFAAYQGAKTAAAALAFQKMTGQALNYMFTSSTPWSFDGHFQNENQPGSQDRIEATGGWLNGLPGFSGTPARDPRTGSRRQVENPLARQMFTMEGALGLQSGHPDWKPEDLYDGLMKALVSKVAPIFDSAWTAGNVNLYQSLSDHQLRAADPAQPAGSISPASLFLGMLNMTPFGGAAEQQAAINAAKGDTNPADSIPGTVIPTSLQGLVKDVGDPAGRFLFSMLTGVNAPYATSQKTRGIKPSDDEYQKAKAYTDTYHQHMSQLSAEALSGQMTPSQWLTAYRELSGKHTAQMEAIFSGSPEYVNGAVGMVSDWEKLYEKATKPDGTLDQDQLSHLQAQFREDPQHTPERMQQMEALLHQNDSKYPMLAMYHKTQAAYDQWQQGWATKNNIDLANLHKELGAYGALYGDLRQQRQYLAQHRDLNAYENAKKREWDRTQQGMMWHLFYGNSAAVNRYLRARHLTQAEFATQEAAA